METIQSIEYKLGYSLPDDYKDFLLKEDKSQYRNKRYCRTVMNGYKTDGQIDYFSTLESFWEDNENRSLLDDYQEEREFTREYFESEFLFIIARCDYQNICMALSGKHKGKIYSSDNGDFGIVFQANSLADFLNSLYDESQYQSNYDELKNAALTNNFAALKELIELKDGDKILNRSSFYDRELFGIAYNLEDKHILEYLISKGYLGYDSYANFKIEK